MKNKLYDLIQENFGETTDEGGGTIGYHLLPSTDITSIVATLSEVALDFQVQETNYEELKKHSDEWYSCLQKIAAEVGVQVGDSIRGSLGKVKGLKRKYNEELDKRDKLLNKYTILLEKYADLLESKNARG